MYLGSGVLKLVAHNVVVLICCYVLQDGVLWHSGGVRGRAEDQSAQCALSYGQHWSPPGRLTQTQVPVTALPQHLWLMGHIQCCQSIQNKITNESHNLH